VVSFEFRFSIACTGSAVLTLSPFSVNLLPLRATASAFSLACYATRAAPVNTPADPRYPSACKATFYKLKSLNRIMHEDPKIHSKNLQILRDLSIGFEISPYPTLAL
jgi:hypothetical protein